ncbi:hypothetical protein LTR08_003900 [Meristemomyces frigidus]|nr:hypothetical protein LTR08_003900 [Meristemomyces frigidus]
MNGSTSPHPQLEPVDESLPRDGAPAGVDAHPRVAQPSAEQTIHAVKVQDWDFANVPRLEEPEPLVPATRGDEDGNSEAETLIDSPVKKREAEKAIAAIRAEKPAKSRIGSLPVPGEDDDDDGSVATPVQSTEVSDAKPGSSAKASDEDAVGDDMDVDSDKENSSGSLSSARSASSNAISRASSSTRALSELPDLARHGVASSRKRKHRASSVGLPRKRQSMEPPERKVRGFQSEGNGVQVETSPSPKLRSHRRTLSTQSTLLDGATTDSLNKKRRLATHFPVRDFKSGKNSWEGSDASSETTTQGHPDARRLQRGIGRSTSTHGRPTVRELKRHVNKYGFTRLAEACELADIESVKEWREKDPDQLEVAEYAGNKPLQIAALNGNEEVVAYLIEQGCQIDCANVDKDTPLLDAAENGHLEVVQILLKAGVDPLRQNLKGQQALDVVTDDTDDADDIRAALRLAIESWNSVDAKQRREQEEEYRYRAGSNKELHFMARTYENLLRLVTINDRNGVREFLDARVPVDNVIIAAAAKTGDQYLVNMLIAEMTEKKSRQKPHKPMLAVLGTSHFDMVKLLTEVDQFNPTWKDRAGRTWSEQAEEKNGPNWRQEKALFERLYSERSRIAGRRSSSPVTKREGSSKRRVTQGGTDDDSDEPEAPKRKNGRRLMSRRDMRAASGKPLSESDSEEEGSTSDTNAPATEPGPLRTGTSMKPPESPSQKRTVGRPRTKSLSSQPADASTSKSRRRSSSLRGPLEHALPTVEEKPEDKFEEKIPLGKQREAEAMFAVHEAQRLEAKRRETEAAETEVKRAEEQARKAEEERRLQEAREGEAREQAKREEAGRAESARKAEEEQRQREIEMEDARRNHVQDVLAVMPRALAHVLDPKSLFKCEGVGALSFLQEHFTPLMVVREDSGGPWILNAQAAPLLGKRGLELLLPRSSGLGFEMALSREWAICNDFSTREQVNVRGVVSALASHEGRRDSFVDADINMEVSENDWRAELAETVQRLNAVNAAKARLVDGTVRLYCVKLADVLAHLDPLLLGDDPPPINVRYPTPTTRSAEIAATLDKQGIDGFSPRCSTFFSNAMVFQDYRAGLLQGSETVCTSMTDFVVVHAK